MPCPVPDLKNKKESDAYVPGWRKWHMVDLSTLDTKEKWLQKLDHLHPKSLTLMRQALMEMNMLNGWGEK